MSDTVTVTASDVSDIVTVTASDVSDAVTVAVTTVTETVTVTVSNDQGPPGADFDPTQNWIGLVTGAVPTGPTAITGGDVYSYDYGTTTRYRFIATDGSLDAFYTTFNGSAVSGLIATKALNF